MYNNYNPLTKSNNVMYETIIIRNNRDLEEYIYRLSKDNNYSSGDLKSMYEKYREELWLKDSLQVMYYKPQNSYNNYLLNPPKNIPQYTLEESKELQKQNVKKSNKILLLLK